MVLHLLRRILGDDAFFRTLSYFLHKHEFQPVDTHDFMIAIKEITGKNMDWFADMYLYKPGHPVFEVSYKYNESTNKIYLKILQKQDSISRVPIYKMPVNIGVHTSENKTTHELWLSKKKEVFEITVSGRPLMLRFDEGNFLLKEWTFTKTTNELMYQLEYDDVIGRAWAATQLAGDTSENAKKMLAVRAKDDKFWAVNEGE